MSKSQADIIAERAAPLFTRKRNTLYWYSVVNDIYDQAYNFFFNIHPRGHRRRSIPLHTLPDYDLATLENVVTALRQSNHLTIEFVGFTGSYWPQAGTLIQKHKEAAE